jgi:hypothetical protein
MQFHDFDQHVAAPVSVVQGLRSLRSTMHLRYNRRGRIIPAKSGGIDVNGKARNVEYEPRWELWDTDASGREYRIMALEDENRKAMPPGQWLVDRFRKYNPDNFPSLEAMLDFAWADQASLQKMPEDEWRSFCDFMGEWCWDKMEHAKKNFPSAQRN